jgi:hypothetical protein
VDNAAAIGSTIVDFTAPGTLRALSAAIEAYAAERRVVTALVVPWESDAAMIRMAVTSSKVDGWAIEHSNLGTISLSDLDGGRVRVTVEAASRDAEAGDSERAATREKQQALLVAFARQIERRFGTAAATSPELDRDQR